MKEQDARTDPEHRHFAQFPFQRMKEQLIKEKTAQDDHGEIAQHDGVGMELCETLYEQYVQRYQRRIDGHEPECQHFKERVSQGLVEDIGVKNEFEGCGDIVDPAIPVMQDVSCVNAGQLHYYDEQQKKREQA